MERVIKSLKGSREMEKKRNIKMVLAIVNDHDAQEFTGSPE